MQTGGLDLSAFAPLHDFFMLPGCNPEVDDLVFQAGLLFVGASFHGGGIMIFVARFRRLLFNFFASRSPSGLLQA